MKLTDIIDKLIVGFPVYIRDDYEQAVLRLVPTGHGELAYVKWKGKKELQHHYSSKTVFEMEMNGEEITKDEYDEY